MDEKELKEIMELLKAAGVDAQLCDTPVRLSSFPAHCGDPTEPGDDDMSDYVMFPKALLGMNPEMYIPVEGDSMRDAGYEAGDRLRVQFGVVARDGDNVLALIDGRCTVKSLFTDEEGLRWLVPQNENYDAILLTEDMDARILAVVVGVEKASTRASSRSLLQSIRRTKQKRKAAKKLTEEELNALIVKISSEIKIARQWFAVYRAMVDYDVQATGDFQDFCSRVKSLLPDFPYLPDAKELSRMEVQSFAKPIAMWTENNAPVVGARFMEYRRIAMLMASYLSEKVTKN